MKYLLKFALIIVTLVVVLVVHQYFFCPRMNFVPSSGFIGKKWYNPYDNIDKSKWIKANFHAHTNAWHGITNGHGAAKDLHKVYDNLGYQVACVSDYQKINTDARQENYIPVYEHGFNIKKTHQQIIGSNAVLWLDYFLPQTLSNKQHILDELSASGNCAIALNHPERIDGYSAKDMSFLNNYDCIEVLNPCANSFKIWDAALSSGRPIFITANDDLHNIFDASESGKLCTWLNTASAEKEAVINCLKRGKSYGMRIAIIPSEDSLDRLNRIRHHLPYLKSHTLSDRILSVKLSSVAAEIDFIGQSGKILGKSANTNIASYAVQEKDSYVRTAVHFKDGTEIFLNPVYRYNDDPFKTNGYHTVNEAESTLFIILGIFILSGWALILVRILTGKNLLKFIRLKGFNSSSPEPKWVHKNI